MAAATSTIGGSSTHVRRLLDAGIDGVAPFGTTGEGQSFGVAERKQGLDALIAAGVAPERVLAATGCAALPETVELTRHAIACGCAGALVLPPFFWKDVTDDGVYASYAALIDRRGRCAAAFVPVSHPAGDRGADPGATSLRASSPHIPASSPD